MLHGQDALSDPPGFDAARALPADAVEGEWRAADGAAIRLLDYGAPAAPLRGSILFLPGRGDAYEKWLETLAHWRAAGWHCASADWRGQALSGRLGLGDLTGHIDDFAIWVDDLAGLWAAFCASQPAPHVLVAHSMAGHLALRAVVEERVRPDALVMTAPMLGINPAWVPSRVLHPIARVITALGDPRRPAWRGDEKPELVRMARQMLLTHDARRYADEEFWRSRRPLIRMGAASWGWVERALASIRRLERRGVLEAVRVPVLMLATRADRLVSWPAIARAARRLPHCELVAYGPEARHEILREVDAVRDHALGAIAAFLDRTVPARGRPAA
ncbi:alpha/beta fold hydrolase [Novosphingobium colocasiae]|uniref:alpha/beta fold hydrolase n=1 Tax=Novosphingobium colocasiae TaxID=1256513 RepID=UPI0035B075D9